MWRLAIMKELKRQPNVNGHLSLVIHLLLHELDDIPDGVTELLDGPHCWGFVNLEQFNAPPHVP